MAGAPKLIAGTWKEGVGWKPLQIWLWINRTGVWLDDMKNIQQAAYHCTQEGQMIWELNPLDWQQERCHFDCKWEMFSVGAKATKVTGRHVWIGLFFKCILQTNVSKKNAENLHLHNFVKGFVRSSNSQFSKCYTTSTNEVKDNQKLMWNSDLFLAPLISEDQCGLGHGVFQSL